MYIVIYLLFNNIESDWIKVTVSAFCGAAVYAIIELILKHETAFLLIGSVKNKISDKLSK